MVTLVIMGEVVEVTLMVAVVLVGALVVVVG